MNVSQHENFVLYCIYVERTSNEVRRFDENSNSWLILDYNTAL